jgi:hypothetical protein
MKRRRGPALFEPAVKLAASLGKAVARKSLGFVGGDAAGSVGLIASFPPESPRVA